MKRNSLILFISALSSSLLAHPGHSHHKMSDGMLYGHLLWFIIPVIVLIVVFYVIKKRKSAKQ